MSKTKNKREQRGDGGSRFLTVAELSARWNVSIAHAYRLVERGDIPAIRFGSAIRLPLDSVVAYEKKRLGFIPNIVKPGDAA